MPTTPGCQAHCLSGLLISSISTVPPGTEDAAEPRRRPRAVQSHSEWERVVSLVEGAQDIQIPGITPGTTSSLLCPFLKQPDGMWTFRSVSGVWDCTCNLATGFGKLPSARAERKRDLVQLRRSAARSYCHSNTQAYGATMKSQRKRDWYL